MSPVPASFELERFALTPVTDDTVLLEVGGVLLDVPPRSAPPRLLVEGRRRARREHNALESEVDGERLRASFVVPAVDAQTAGFALAVGGLLLELPAPDPTPGSDRTVALARELNGARRELTRMRARIEADTGVAGGHAAELAAAREEAATREQEAGAAAEARAAAAEQDAEARVAAAVEDAEARVSAANQDAAELVERARADAEERSGSAEARSGELEVASSQLETVLADERASAAQRDAVAAAERRDLEVELQNVRGEAESAREEVIEATRREEESSAVLSGLRSELELAQRALEGRDAELARSPDRRARAVARPRTVAGATGEHAAVEPERDEEASMLSGSEELTVAAPSPDAAPDTQEVGPDEDELTVAEPEAEAVAPDEEATTVAPPEDDTLEGTVELDAVRAEAAPLPPVEGVDGDPFPDDDGSDPVLDDGSDQDLDDDGDPVPDDDGSDSVPDDGDPVPDDGEADSTMTHDVVRTPRPDPEPPEDTGPIPLRRSSQRRYVPRSDRDEELGSDEVRVLGRERPRASALPPAPDGESGLPAGLTPRTAVLGVMAIAAFLVLVAILGYVF